MHKLRQFTAVLSFSIVVLCACKARTEAAEAQASPPPTPLTHIDSPQGGVIVYGLVDGAKTQAAAMSRILRSVHDNCGEKPQVGQVFKVRNTDSVAVFFNVVNHPGGNKQVAGLVIAAVTGPNRVEAALVSDSAARFGQSVNPMLTQLFSVWHPAGAAPSHPAGNNTAHAAGASAAAPPALHRVMLPDRSASVAIPDGWNVMPSTSGGGTINVLGPNHEMVMLNNSYMATDPNNPQVRQLRMMAQQYGQRYPDNKLYYPYGVNPAKAFIEIRHWNDVKQNIHPAFNFEVKSEEQIQSRQPCAHLTGITTLDGVQVQWEFDAVYCEDPPSPGGIWLSSAFITLVPVEQADRERATVRAIEQSFTKDMSVINGQANAIAAPAIAAINQIGRDATARFNATQQANDAQHAGYWAQQDTNARNSQGFSNYLLDQTVIQDNNVYGNGTVGHGTVWNSTANALVKADPNRYEIVNTPNFWQGVDY